jgi:peptidoglycan hydrolase CwlO-like protein
MKELAWAIVLLPFIMMGSVFVYGRGVFREGATSKHPTKDKDKDTIRKVSKNLQTQVNYLVKITDTISGKCKPDKKCNDLIYDFGK